MTENELLKKTFRNPNIYIARFNSCTIGTHVNTATNKTFNLFEFNVTILSDGLYKNMEMRGTMSVSRAQRYFQYCGIKTQELRGQLVQVTVGKRTYISQGDEYEVDEIRYLNVLKPNGNPYIMVD